MRLIGIINEHAGNYSKREVEQYQELRESHSILAYGAPIPRDGKSATWANSVFKNPLPIDYTLAKIQDLFTDRIMKGNKIKNTINSGLNYKTINGGLTTYLKNYCELENKNRGISKYDISCKGLSVALSGEPSPLGRD